MNPRPEILETDSGSGCHVLSRSQQRILDIEERVLSNSLGSVAGATNVQHQSRETSKPSRKALDEGRSEQQRQSSHCQFKLWLAL